MTSANDGLAASGTAPTATKPAAPAAAPPPAPPADPVPTAEPVRPAEVEDQTPFWMPWHPHWPVFPARAPRHPPPRRPVFGIAGLVVLGLVAAFVAWVSAEPMWLAVGHGERGTAAATRCSVEGVPYECVTFTATGGRYAAEDVTLLGTEHRDLRPGTSVPAQMVSPHSSRAYVADGVAIHLRAWVGLALILLCGLGIAWATGANRLEPPATRRTAFLACLGAPLLLTLGFLAATW